MRKKFINTKELRKRFLENNPDFENSIGWHRSTINATRSAAEFWGWDWADDIACMRDGKKITYAELKQEKIKKQKRQLELKRQSDKLRKVPVFVEAFYNDPKKCMFYSGWWTWIYNRTFEKTVNFRGTEWLIEPVMQAFPLGFLPFQEMYYEWMPLFAKDGKRKAWAWIHHNRIIKLEAV